MTTKETAIYPQANGGFFVDKKYKGFRIRKKGFETKKEAEQYLEEEKSYIDRIDKDERGIKLKKISLEILFKEYLSTQNISIKTIRNKSQLFYNYIYVDWPIIAHKEDRDFVSLYNNIIEKTNQRGISKRQGNAAMSLLNRMIAFGKDKGYVRFDVSIHEEMYFKKTTKKHSEKTEKNFLLVGQYETLMEALDFLKHHPSLLPAKILDADDFEFFLYMLGHIGLRIGEMRALTFNDLFKDVIDDKVIYKIRISKQFSDESKEVYNWTKTGAERSSVVPDFLVAKINDHKLKHNFDNNDFIFNTLINKKKNEGRSILAKSFRELLKKVILILKENGMLPEYFNHDISCNALRRTAEDYLTTVDAVDTKTASDVMGHSERVAFIHYKKSQMEGEKTIASRQENNASKKEFAPVQTIPVANSEKVEIETKYTSLDEFIKLLQNVVVDHVMGKISDDEYEKIKAITHKLLV